MDEVFSFAVNFVGLDFVVVEVLDELDAPELLFFEAELLAFFLEHLVCSGVNCQIIIFALSN